MGSSEEGVLGRQFPKGVTTVSRKVSDGGGQVVMSLVNDGPPVRVRKTTPALPGARGQRC